MVAAPPPLRKAIRDGPWWPLAWAVSAECIAIAQDVPAGQFPPADMVLVEDDRAARVAIGASVSEPVSADEARPVMDVDGTAVEIVRAERGVRYARVTSDDCVDPAPACGTLIRPPELHASCHCACGTDVRRRLQPSGDLHYCARWSDAGT